MWSRQTKRTLLAVGLVCGYVGAAGVGVVVILAVGGGGDVVGQWLGFLGVGGVGGVVVARVNAVHADVAAVKEQTTDGGLSARVQQEVGKELARLDAMEDRAEWEAQRRRRPRGDA